MAGMNTNRKIMIACIAAIFAISILLIVKGINGGTDGNSTEVVKSGVDVTHSADETADGMADKNTDEADKTDGMADGTGASGAAVSAEGNEADKQKTENGKSGKGGENDKDSKEKKADGSESEKESGTKKNSADKKSASDDKDSSKGSKKTEGKSKGSAKKKSVAGSTAGSEKTADKSSGEPKKGEESSGKEEGTASAEAPAATEEKKTCSLTVTCSEVFSHMDKLSESAKKVIPENGMILQGTYEIVQGETAFDLLKRACAEKKILLDYSFTPLYSSYYIRGINNLYEFDCGDESGWMYQVNDSDPGYGCNQYTLSKGDKVVFYYTCEY